MISDERIKEMEAIVRSLDMTGEADELFEELLEERKQLVAIVEQSDCLNSQWGDCKCKYCEVYNTWKESK